MSSAKADDPGDAAAMLEGDDEELERLGAQRRVVDNEVVDMFGGGEEAAEKTTGGATAARRGEAATALCTR